MPLRKKEISDNWFVSLKDIDLHRFFYQSLSVLNFSIVNYLVFGAIGKSMTLLEDSKRKYLYDLRAGKNYLNKV